MSFEKSDKKVLLGVLLRQAQEISKNGSFKPEYYNELENLTYLLARAGHFSKAFDLINKIKRKSKKESLFYSIIKAYRLYLSAQIYSSLDEIEKLGDVEVILRSSNIKAARLRAEYVRHKSEKWELYLIIYKFTKNEKDLKKCLFCFKSIHGWQENIEAKEKINEACGKKLFDVEEKEKVEEYEIPPKINFDELLDLFSKTGKELYLQDLINFVYSLECPAEKLAHIRRIINVMDEN